MGLTVSRTTAVPPVPVKVADPNTMEAGMVRARDKYGIKCSTVIDLGAAAGTWTRKAMSVWPDPDYVLFEPLEERRPDLDALARENARVRPVIAAVGNRNGKVAFLVSNDLDGSGVYDSEQKGGNREVALVTVDGEMERLRMRPPFVIKFDTHGYETPILEGARETLRQTELVIMECYSFRISESCLVFHEMCAKMDELGFRLGDIIHVLRRPGDGIFWQCDAFFIRKDHPAFTKSTFV